MKRLAYSRPHRLALLRDQLLAAGIVPLQLEGDGAELQLSVADDAPEALIASVVAAHDPGEEFLASWAEAASSRRELQEQYTLALTRLDAITTSGGSYTAAQVRDAVVDLAVILRRLLRVMV